MLSGCGVYEIKRDQAAITERAKANFADSPKSRPIVLVHESSLLMGEKIRASKPQPEIFNKPVVFKEKRALTLSEIATWITQTVHVPTVVEPSAQSSAAQQAASSLPAAMRSAGGPLPAGGIGTAPSLASPLPGFNQASTDATIFAPAPSAFQYTGMLGGFLQTVEAQFNVYSRYRDGVVSFFRTETRTFTVPTLPDVSSMSGSITTGSNGSSSSSGSQSASNSSSSSPTASGSSGGGSTGSGGQSMQLDLQMQPWQTLQATTAAIAGPGATVVADKNLGVLTVTGTPQQCDRVEQWMKSLTAMYGKLIAIEVDIYQVQRTRGENYGMNLTLAYKGANGHTGLTVTGAPAPNVSGNAKPLTFGASILGGTLTGTTAAIQALSTLGNVTQLVSRSGVTQNGKQMGLQAAKRQSYVQSTSTTLAASVGSSTSIQTDTIVPGFTSSFIPKVVDGRILIDFDMTMSDLIRLDTFTSGTGTSQSSVQLPLEQVTRFQQSISLKPGESLVLTGMRQQSTSVTNNGVGAPWMPLVGGGVDAQNGDTIISVVISARLI
ncbi:secretin N-terminal domain-containing protein [Burkholderia cenocepacia]|nr:secretin N-terminal domain-containing protein [Burkholderia cenocepacia]MCW3587393.1 secretin N-terminal domain-containing protein [Burkholderia cenocepacia]MCW3632597.1 secretin N-terminal domain-containing protein [Burkholderia cenocepacia]NGO98043.1 pilus assembly protein PilN [Burkholderia cenocepacia]